MHILFHRSGFYGIYAVCVPEKDVVRIPAGRHYPASHSVRVPSAGRAAAGHTAQAEDPGDALHRQGRRPRAAVYA